METWVAEGKTSAGAGAGGQTVAQSRDDGRRAAIPRAPPHCLPCPLALLPLHTLAPPRFHRRIMCRHSLLPRPQIPHPPPSSLHLCTPHRPPPHSCPQHPRRATCHPPMHSQLLHRRQRAHLGRHRTRQRVAGQDPNGDVGGGGGDVSCSRGWWPNDRASRNDGRRDAIPCAPPHSPRHAPHRTERVHTHPIKHMLPLPAAMTADPSPSTCTRRPSSPPHSHPHLTHPTDNTPNVSHAFQSQSAHKVCIDDNKPISVGIVPVRELRSGSLIEM